MKLKGRRRGRRDTSGRAGARIKRRSLTGPAAGAAEDRVLQPLRHLAVTVIQSAKGYRWRVAELTRDGQWFTVDEQASPMKAYSAAMAAGLLHLQGLWTISRSGRVKKIRRLQRPRRNAERSASGLGCHRHKKARWGGPSCRSSKGCRMRLRPHSCRMAPHFST
ncbi:hypothetical protein [Variovorax paradoxus]|uniref:hypothetical protein n=1 Tax=Variovorax paradoxus TaxID=34073 RepID=UPI003992B410